MSILEKIYKSASQDENIALATIVATWGSTPQTTGAIIAVKPDGNTIGTVGGGCVERLIIEYAILALRQNRPLLKDYNLTEEGYTEMLCGGKMRVFIEPLREGKDLFEFADSEARSGRTTALSTVISVIPDKNTSSSLVGKKMLVTSDGTAAGTLGMGEEINKLVTSDSLEVIRKGSPRLKIYSSAQIKEKEATVFINIIPGEANLIIAGGGHIAKPLSKMAKILGFNVTVVDDRKEYANKSRFPLVNEVICGDFKEVFSSLTFNKNSYVVVVTYGHRYDEQILEEVLKSETAYIGCIGSRSKAKQTLQHLKRAGYSEEDVKRICIPVGLDIGAKTPAEIALSILAEIVKEKRKIKGK